MIRKGDWLDIKDTEAKLVHGVGMKLSYPFTVHGSRFTDLRSLWQLTAAADPLGNTVSLTYDVNGRPKTRTDRNGPDLTYAFTSAGNLSGINLRPFDPQPATRHPSTRNPEGVHPFDPRPATRQPATPKASGGTCLTFDYNRRLVEIGSDTQFSYDGRGNRLSATRAGVATRYIYDPWGNLLAEADSSNNIVHKYVYGRGLLALATSSARYCYHFNGTGSTIAITDATGTVVNTYAYDPFGQILNQQETVPQPFKYVGQYGVMAEPNGLYYMRARYYDPSVGRFVSEDPLGFGGGDVNLFAYVQDNPINLVDPLGLATSRPQGPGLPLILPPVFYPGTPENQTIVNDVNYIANLLNPAPLVTWIGDQITRVCESRDDTKRCQKVLESCRDDCIAIYANNPNWLPGTGTDMKGRLRRCIRDCMKANGCHNY